MGLLATVLLVGVALLPPPIAGRAKMDLFVGQHWAAYNAFLSILVLAMHQRTFTSAARLLFIIDASKSTITMERMHQAHCASNTFIFIEFCFVST